MRKISCLLPLVSLLGCGTTGTDCTDMDAPSGLVLAFEPVISTPGTWAFDLAEGFSAHCEVDLPAPNPPGKDWENPCSEYDFADLDFSDDWTSVTDLSIQNEAPASVRLTVSFDEGVVFDETITPKYEVDEPNGEGCGDRHLATVSVKVPQS
jgi:hypothetical protein